MTRNEIYNSNENKKYIINLEDVRDFIEKLEYDFFHNENTKLLHVKNNREYWLFTEYRERIMKFLDVNDDNLKERRNIENEYTRNRYDKE